MSVRKKVESLLPDKKPRRSRQMDDMPELVEALEAFFELKREGDERAHVSFHWFYRHKLRPTFGGPPLETVYCYVRDVMRLDVKTGKRLGEET